MQNKLLHYPFTMNCCKIKRHLTITSDNGPSTSTRASRPGSKVPEELLTCVVGSCNRWRILVMLVFCVIMIFDGLNLFASELFIPLHLGFNCTDGSSWYNTCFTLNGSRCHSFQFSRRYGQTLTEKWNLVCDKQVVVEVSTMVFRCGLALGYIVMGNFADRWGRKKILFLCLTLQPCSGILVTASRGYTSFTISRFFNGFALSGSALVAIVLTCETSSNKWRTFDLGLLCLSFAIGHALLSYVWMIFADSMKNILVMSIPQIILIAFISVIRESPNWLLCKNRTITAESVLTTVARFNGQKMPSTFRLRPVQIINITSKRSMGFFIMFKPSKMRWIILSLCVTWFLLSLLIGLTTALLIKEHQNLLEITLLTGISCIVAAIANIILCHLIRHRAVIALSAILGGVTATIAYVVIGITEDANTDKFMLTHLIVYACYTLAFYSLWNLTPRIFPTEMRGEGTGVTLAVGELTSTFGRLLLPYIYTNVSTFLITLWCLIVIVVICCLLLVSVHKRELPDLIEDAVNFRHTCKPTRWSTLRATSPTLDETEVKIVDFERGTSQSVEQGNQLMSIFRK